MAVKTSIKIDNDALQKALDRIVENEVYRWKQAGVKALEDVREGAVGTWYNNGKGKGNHINTATKYETKMSGTGRNSDKVTITISSYVDSEMYKEIVMANQEISKYGNWTSGIEAWKARHSVDGWTYYNKKNGVPHPAISMHYTTGEYLVYQLWDKGIVGLPAGARETGTGWVNPKPPKDREPMREYVTRMVNEKWGKKTQELHGKI